MKKKTLIVMFTQLTLLSPFIFAQTRVVCVGNSVTAGYELADANTQSWPAQLRSFLGSNYMVYNCGVSGTTMLKKPSSSYWNTSTLTTAKNYDPQIVIISLGTNDAHPDNWIYKNDFYNDYSAMIDQFRLNGRNPQIYICYPVACYGDATQTVNLQNELIPLVTQISLAKGVSIIDFNKPTQNQRNTLYNDNLHPNAAGATVLATTAFNTIMPAVPAFYSNCNYSGYAIKLGIGDYNLSALQSKGISDNDISSIRVPQGYKVFAYVNDNFGGNYLTLTADNSCLGGWDNLFTSLRVRANGLSGKNGTYSLQNRNSAKYMDVAGGNAADGTNILQWTGTGNANQQFTLTELGDGAYKIINVGTNKSVDVSGGNYNNVGNVLQWTYGGGLHQQFILIATDNNFFKLKAAHSGRLVEVYGARVNDGDNIDQYDDNSQNNGQWKLAAPGSTASTTATLKTQVITSEELSANLDKTLLYPNPATGHITLTDIPAETKVTIYDLNGRVKLQITSPGNKGDFKINIHELKPGTYILNAGSGNDKRFKFFRQAD